MRVCFCLWTANHPPRFHLCVPSAGGRAQLHWKKVKLIRKSISSWWNLIIIPHRKDYDLKSLAKTPKSMQQKRLTTKLRRIEFVVIFYSILLGAFISYLIYTYSWASPVYIYLLIAIFFRFFLCNVILPRPNTENEKPASQAVIKRDNRQQQAISIIQA